jgi:hypothetical protein
LILEPQPDRQAAIRNITQHIPKLVTLEKKNTLLREITLEDVEHAILDMTKGKYPVPNGFTTSFFMLVGP